VAAPIYLADTSALVLRRLDARARERHARLTAEGRLAACQMTTLEFLNTATSPSDHATILAALNGGRWMDVTTDALDRAIAVHSELAGRSQHREFSLPDLIIAATAEQHGATVLHYDADYDRIAEITGQPTEWIVERGSL